MTNAPHIIELALLLLIAFLIGCVLGYFLRVLFRSGDSSGEATSTDVVASSAKPAPEIATAKTAPKTAPKTTTAKKVTAPKKSAPRKAAPEKAPAKKTAAQNTASAPSADDRPAALTAPRDGTKDDLKKIKGIGPKIEGTLNNLGIYHFDQIAGWNRKSISWVDNDLSFKGRIDREKWVSQAKQLAKK